MGKGIALVLLGVCFASSFVGAEAGSGGCRGPEMHSVERHASAKGHRYLCRMKLVASTVISKTAGVGSIEFHKNVGAVLQRDEGIVALLDMSIPARPKTVGLYDDGAQDSFDGDLAFSHDGQFLFYARQTHQFSQDGIHVLDVSDPSAPAQTFYQGSGGTLEVAYYYDGSEEWVIFLDAIDGLVITRFVRESGSLVEVFRDPNPTLSKVGGPASAGLIVEAKDPKTEMPILYVSTGGIGLQIYDFSSPATPVLLGEWTESGTADIVVRASATKRTVYAATEYWFDSGLKPQVLVLDATDPENIKKAGTRSLKLPAEHMWRVQGMAWGGRRLLVAHSHAGLVGFNSKGALAARALLAGPVHADAEPPSVEQSGQKASAYAMDVEKRGRFIYLTDAATGALHILRPAR